MLVDYHSEIGGEITSRNHKVKSIEKRYGQWIAFISGKSGFVCVNALTEIKPLK